MSLSITPTNDLSLQPIGSLGLAGAEIAAFDPGSDRLFVTSSVGLQVVDLSNPAAPSIIATLDFTAGPFSFATTDVTSVATKGGIVAVALPAADKAADGQVIFLDAATSALLGSVTVGALPDSLTFTPDGTKVLVANEGEFLTDGTAGGKGSVSIIDISAGIGSATVQTAGFTAFDGQEAALRAEGVRIFAGDSVSDDVEPEYVAISADGTKAMLTLQEANAVGLLDIATATFTDIVSLGTKDFSTLLADFSDRDGAGGATATNLTTGNPVFGLYMPDAISSFEADGATYYIMANEGDDRDDFVAPDETIRVGSGNYDLDDTIFPDEAALKNNADLGRLTVSNAPGLRGDTDSDGDIDQILAYGARSFTIRDASGALVFDSADMIERIVATEFPALFDDTRSDNKGPEPEGLTVGEIDGRTYAFVALERSNMSLVFDITDPEAVSYTGAAQRDGDVSPEGALFIAAADSPTGTALYVTSNEVSNNITVFEVEHAAPFTLQLLHFADAEAGLLAGQTAPNLAALVDAFDDDYANTLILAGGDNYIPGPFLAAGTDASVAATHDKGNNPGATDIEIHNRIGVEASTIGNHEFDLGTNAFSDAVNDAAFPYLSANLDFSADGGISARYQETVGVNGLEDASTLARKIVPSAVVNKGGELIGLVGATTQILETISSTGNVEVEGFAGDGSETNDMVLLASQLQIVIDDLRDQGVNKIILMAHLQQIAFEIALAPLLEGVDIILAAGSNTRLGDADDVAVAFPGHAANFADDYPILTAGADGDVTLIVNTDNEFTYLGRLVVEFDAEGRIITDSLDEGVNGAYAATSANVAAAWGVDEADLDTTAFADGTKGAEVKEITDAVQGVINAKDGEIWGYTDVYLEGERNLVRNQETNLGNITADANLLAAQEALGGGAFVGSLKNGGGIRAQIGAVDVVSGDKEPPLANPAAGKPAGAVSSLDIENSLRFNNLLMVFDTDAAGLKAILEHGVALLGNQGRFPQLGGISFSYDPDLAAGSRILNVAVIDEAGNVIARVIEDGVVSEDAPTTISMVALNFLANGGDGFPVKANASNFRYLLADGTLSAPLDEALDFTAAGNIPAGALGEQQAMKEFMAARHATPAAAFDEADTAPSGDTRIQDLNARVDTVLDGERIAGNSLANTLDGTAGDDVMYGQAGDDLLRGMAGADTIYSGIGADTLFGGSGDDLLTGQNATMFGEGGDDVLLGRNGNETLDGGEGADTMSGGKGADEYVVDDAGDLVVEALSQGPDSVLSLLSSYTLPIHVEHLTLGSGALDGIGNGLANMLLGNGLDNLLIGGLGWDTILGGDGADSLDGGVGSDSLVGGAGADTLFGSRQADTMEGGDGADIFLFTSQLDGLVATPDVIADFVRGEDRISLDFDANRSVPGVQDFAFATLPFAARTPGFVRVETVDPNTVVVFANNDADADAEFALLVRGVATLDASDFI